MLAAEVVGTFSYMLSSNASFSFWNFAYLPTKRNHTSSVAPLRCFATIICPNPRKSKEAVTEKDKKTGKEIIKKKAQEAEYIEQHTSINVVKYGFLAISALLISIIFIPLCRKEYAYCGIGSFALAFLVLTLSPIALSLRFLLVSKLWVA